MKTCSVCHKTVSDDAIFCTNCGNKLIEISKEEISKPLPSQKKKKVAFLLALFGGIIGLHDLYLGRKNAFIIKVALGIISLGILSLLVYVYSLIEGLYIFLNKNYKDAYGRPLL